MGNSMDEHALLGEVVERLAGRYPTLPPDVVKDVVHDVYAKFDAAPIREFVPLLVEREAHSALSEHWVPQHD
ncbi:MAG: three-helix bundle dimerization domain-containing protein [Mycobacterium sp.]